MAKTLPNFIEFWIKPIRFTLPILLKLLWGKGFDKTKKTQFLSLVLEENSKKAFYKIKV
ncbi:hypothetical protein H6F50_16565 [Coleofasciculus sp. FACHB-712]|uniref:hypothetical protein n=1 Tax=Coleofasciculus sp. FACHB-712 TaxID=2692789 RepID=UPI0016878496|nr:hypothetical protein [Coleofasciculus sp. FACHB-712]MBD1943954.1 hypothetical protein [Coleofasciculus sp. FACHB-712]